MKYIIIFLILITTTLSFSQELENDTIPDDEVGWEEFHEPELLFRVGLGYQRSLFGELGITRIKYIGQERPIGIAYYSSIELTPSIFKAPEDIYGFKIGGEITTLPYSAGLEAKIITDFAKTDLIITPRVGLGFFGYLYFYYGHNVSLSKEPFSSIGSHQLSIVTHPFILNKIFKKKEPEVVPELEE